MFVLVAMERARDPKYYRWMWSDESSQQRQLHRIELPATKSELVAQPSESAAADSAAPQDPLGAAEFGALNPDAIRVMDEAGYR